MEQACEVTEDYSMISRHLPGLVDDFSSIIFAWDGDGTPKWITDLNGKKLPQLRKLCRLEADISGLHDSLKPRRSVFNLGSYYQTPLTIFILLGGTKLQARLRWKEKGTIREGPVTIVPGALE
ncbi:hypothetical protein M408DRAFT_26539 [Serendipita vermifera MAFF 305830]|uniref:Uncharacterized protein n=1 Tax=Serendipita vermifera MAFF 305830 TaxID=933852 RepID=A0A0C3AYV0_SERVB|nr:hypothetical protein M408DRAFT_26539 [Serendipita vermifera MAFF 305830]